MEITKRFKIANQWIEVELCDFVEDDGEQLFGLFSSVYCKIWVARQFKRNGAIVTLSEEQILNTFWHEVFHCFNYYWNNDLDESLAQTFSNFMREYQSTKE